MNSNQRKEVNKKVFPCHVTVDKILKSDLALLLDMLLVVQTFRITMPFHNEVDKTAVRSLPKKKKLSMLKDHYGAHKRSI